MHLNKPAIAKYADGGKLNLSLSRIAVKARAGARNGTGVHETSEKARAGSGNGTRVHEAREEPSAGARNGSGVEERKEPSARTRHWPGCKISGAPIDSGTCQKRQGNYCADCSTDKERRPHFRHCSPYLELLDSISSTLLKGGTKANNQCYLRYMP